MAESMVAKVIDNNKWAGADGEIEAGPFNLRFRTPILGPEDTGDYVHLLSVTWPYADAGAGAMPDDAKGNAMRVFENRLVEAWERDHNAILTAVLTIDGARQWVFYTRDVDVCGKRISEIPQEKEPYPVELNTEQDPEWGYLRGKILALVPWQEYQEEWKNSLK